MRLPLGLLVVAALAAARPPGEVHRHALAQVEIDLDGPPGHTLLVARFAVPVGRYQWRPRPVVTAIPPDPPPRVEATWIDPHLLVVTVVEPEPPFGRELRYRIAAAGGWAGLAGLDLRGRYRQPVTPAVLAVEPGEVVPSRGPVILRFNTFVEPASLRLAVVPGQGGPPAPGSLGPVEGDASRWRFDPDPPLRNGESYRFRIEPGLRGPGDAAAGPLEASFRVAPAVRWVRLPGGPIPLYPELEAVADQELAEAEFVLQGVPGRTTLEGARVTFQPDRALTPSTAYLATVRGRGLAGEPAPETWISLRTEDVPGYWLEVCLTPPQTVRAYRGGQLLRVMLASAGRPDKPTPAGTFRVGGRGESFWNPRYGEGAYYWVRFHGSYLFHSVPFDASGEIMPGEELKLGWPASHGCVRLDLPDARWIYERIPDGSPVIIHP